MTDFRSELEHDIGRIGPATFTFNDVVRKRDRKRRNQRIAAGIVGVALFVAAIWIVRDVVSLDRTETTVVPGGSSATGPAETGPAETGATVHLGEFYGLPPEGAEPSSPEQGKLVASAREIHVGSAYVYADGRVISWSEGPAPHGYREQRLTPKGIELVRSGAIPAIRFLRGSDAVPADAWEDPEARPYVPYRYAICADEGTISVLPTAAADLVRGKERTFQTGMSGPGWDCYDVTTERARALDEILTDAGFLGEGGYPERSALVDVKRSANGDPFAWVSFYPVLPHGAITHQLG